jgi:hypothetical protein
MDIPRIAPTAIPLITGSFFIWNLISACIHWVPLLGSAESTYDITAANAYATLAA